MALNRFYLNQFRGNFADRLVDLVIAAEALFLNVNEGELSYRLATRAAIFLADTRPERITIFRQVRSAYGARNRVVHGSQIDAPAVIQGARDMETVMRDAIVKALMLVDAGKPEAITNWDDWSFLDL